MFESIFTSTADNSINISQAAISLGASIVIGVIIAIVYMYISKKEGYQKNFIIGLLMLPAVVSVVILLVGSNVARAFSMAGAFALVRFRSAPGSAKDISIVFFTMAAGLACGLGYVTFAAAFTAVMLLLLILISALGFVDRNEGRKQLKIVIPESLNYNSVFDDLFDSFPFYDNATKDVEKKLYGRKAAHMMKTDIKEKSDGYELVMDLPGFTKDEVQVTLENGYLTVEAEKGLDKDEKEKETGHYIRKERYAGAMSRSFYVGENVEQEDVKAEFKHGILKLFVPKKEAKPAVEKKNHIAIEG